MNIIKHVEKSKKSQNNRTRFRESHKDIIEIIDLVSESDSDTNDIVKTLTGIKTIDIMSESENDSDNILDKNSSPTEMKKSSKTLFKSDNTKFPKNSKVKDECMENSTMEIGFANVKENVVIKNSIQSTGRISEEEIYQYIGDIIDFDLDDNDLEQISKKQCSTTIVNIQGKICDESETEKNKNAKLHIDKKSSEHSKKDLNIDSKKTSIPTSLKGVLSLKPMTIKPDSILPFFWFDAFEDPYNQPGTLYLFGKTFVKSTDDFVSCCVAVKSIPRRIYLLPRKYILKDDSEKEKELNTFTKVHDELKACFRKHNVHEFRYKEVSKAYVFEKKDIPQTATYVEVKYSSSRSIIDSNYSGPAIQAVFGTSFNALELFLIDKNIKGPCWLDVKEPPSYVPNPAIGNKISWCKLEINEVKLEDISVAQNKNTIKTVPPIILTTLNIMVSFNPNLHQNEVIGVGVLLHHKFQFDKTSLETSFIQQYCLITRSLCINWPKNVEEKIPKIGDTKIIYCDTEFYLLKQLLDILHRFDPDIILSHDSEFKFEFLISKIFKLRMKDWSKIGKLKILKIPYFKGKIYLNQIFCGRPICDIGTSLKELKLKTASFDLSSLCAVVLNKTLNHAGEFKPEDYLQYHSSIEKLQSFLQFIITTTSYMLEIAIELNILPLAFELTKIAGNTLSKTLSTGVSERNEFLLLHAFHANNYILPDKKNEQENVTADTKSTFCGGLILEPKTDYFDKLVLLMDFNSLYPSIIQEFNVCFTTIPGAAHADIDNIRLTSAKAKTGIIPTEIGKLVESRYQLKKMLQTPNLSPELKRQYNTRQLALKLMANSMFGCLGANYSRFYAKGLAAFVAMKGREILLSTKGLIQKLDREIIYGDTDSIMINTKTLDYEKVMSIGRDIKRCVNKLYRKIELDIDKVFRYLLLIKKRQYAALVMQKLPNGDFQYSKEIKGLEVIRRDRCVLACDCGNQILDQILSDQQGDLLMKNIFDILDNTSKILRNGKVPLSSLKIIKQLSKDPEKYLENKNQPHAIVAKRLNKTSTRKWKAGDIVPYVICEDGTKRAPQERTYHIEEFEKSNNLKIDIKYYLTHQIYPVIIKICNPIEGIDDLLVAQHLGIKELLPSIQSQGGDVPLFVRENRYDNCAPFVLICQNQDCKAENQIKTALIESPIGLRLSLEKCSNVQCFEQPWKYVYAIKNKLQLDIRKYISKYYLGEIKCDNPLCSKIVRKVSLDSSTDVIKCYDCLDGNFHRIYNESELYKQLNFFLHIFTVNQNYFESLNILPPAELIDAYNSVEEFIIDEIENNAYGIIDLSKIYYSNITNKDINSLNISSSVL